MHKEILTEEQIKLLPLVQRFSRNFGLVGGTAIALHLGHRRSIDFDLFTRHPFDTLQVRARIRRLRAIQTVVTDQVGQYTVIIDGVRLTFFHYPFPITFRKRFQNIITLPDLLTLAAMKAYALGRRAKWKDYVDLYFIAQNYHGLTAITARAHTIFGKEFNEKLFRAQLSYFKDINYSEEVIYLPGFETGDAAIRRTLEKISVS